MYLRKYVNIYGTKFVTLCEDIFSNWSSETKMFLIIYNKLNILCREKKNTRISCVLKLFYWKPHILLPYKSEILEGKKVYSVFIL